MEYFNLTPLLLLVIIFFLICIFLLVIFIKVKKSRICFLIIVVIIIAGVKIHDRIINSVFYNFEGEICRKYPKINNVELGMSYGGRYGSINVYIEEEIEDENIENIFIDILNIINKEPMSSYLKGSSNLKNKSWVIFDIEFYGKNYMRFTSGPYHHSDWFTEKNQQEQTWENSKTAKMYYYSDYNVVNNK
jgi:hypothetical protein